MSKVAIFVDAGYLFGQGSTALAGSKQARSLLNLNVTAVIAELMSVMAARCGTDLLRIYWYDGALGSGNLTSQHTVLAHTDHVKLRLGYINSVGQQKGVDSLIVTDLIELARNHAVSDGILLGGDEDLRIGVQIAQSFGVRIHLVGIAPCRGSQSIPLMQECDTTTEWDRSSVTKFLSFTASAQAALQPAGGLSSATITPSPMTPEEETQLKEAAKEFANNCTSDQIIAVEAFKKLNPTGVPREMDGPLLAAGKAKVGHSLRSDEKRLMRREFHTTILPRLNG